MQDTFISVFSSIHTYQSAGSFEGWLKRIAVNHCLKHLKKSRFSFKELDESGLQSITSIEPTVFASLSEEEMLQMIARLPLGYRLVFNLYVIEGYDHNEIANMLHIKPATSRSQLIKARRALQLQFLSNQNIEHYGARRRV